MMGKGAAARKATAVHQKLGRTAHHTSEPRGRSSPIRTSSSHPHTPEKKTKARSTTRPACCQRTRLPNPWCSRTSSKYLHSWNPSRLPWPVAPCAPPRKEVRARRPGVPAPQAPASDARLPPWNLLQANCRDLRHPANRDHAGDA